MFCQLPRGDRLFSLPNMLKKLTAVVSFWGARAGIALTAVTTRIDDVRDNCDGGLSLHSECVLL